MMSEGGGHGDARPGFVLKVFPCPHCFNCYCYCITSKRHDYRQAVELVEYRHRMSVARAGIGQNLAETEPEAA
jgi:hypothetical protein